MFGFGYFELLLWTSPALLLAFWAQMRVKSAFAQAQKVPVPLSGAAAARHILDCAGLQDVDIEQIPGQLSDHYDPRAKVLRLSQAVYSTRSTAAVGIAAHEAGHAIQDAKRYVPLVVRNAAVPAAGFGSNASMLMLIGGLVMGFQPLILFGIAAFACVVVFQLVNLPVEFDASARAKRLLVEHRIVADQDMVYVNRVLNAAAWTYVAATLQAVITLLFYIIRYAGGRD
ncbi:MAG: zinc metallopeptidase [Pirellulales bacterium]|nr:zinc metallopeptidase [Pirellulales bacterium]